MVRLSSGACWLLGMFLSTYLRVLLIYLVCLFSSLYLFIYLSIICREVGLSIRLSIAIRSHDLTIWRSIGLSIDRIDWPVYVSIDVSVYLSIYLSIYLYLSVHLSIHRHIYLSIYLLYVYLSVYAPMSWVFLNRAFGYLGCMRGNFAWEFYGDVFTDSRNPEPQTPNPKP